MKDDIVSTIYSEVPLLDKLQGITAKTWNLLFANPISRILWELIYLVTVTLIFTYQFRSLAHSLLFSILMMAVLVIFFFFLDFLSYKFILPLVSNFVLGAPVFGKIGGLPQKFFFTVLKCADAIHFDFKPADLDRVKEWGRIDRDVTEQTLKNNYRAALLKELKTTDVPADFDEKWSGVWQENILTLGTKNSSGEMITLDDFLADDNFASTVEPLKLQVVTALISPTYVAFQIIMIFFIDKYIRNQINMVTMLQVSLFFSLIISLLLFNFHAHQNAEIPFIGIVSPPVPKAIADLFTERLKNIGKQPFRPSKVTIKKPYISLIRNYFAKFFFWVGGVVNACLTLLILGVSLLLGLILHPASFNTILPWYKDMAIGLALMPLGILAGYYVAFFTIQYARVLVAPIIIGILAAILPYALGYLFTGRIDFAQIQNGVWAAVSGISASLVTAITSQVKSNLEGSADQ
jgi:hypothetical protein